VVSTGSHQNQHPSTQISTKRGTTFQSNSHLHISNYNNLRPTRPSQLSKISNTPAEVINKLNREINAALVDPKMKSQLANLGGTTLILSPADFAKMILQETEKWAKVIREANIKPA
jgi:hypothetical protein